MRTLPSSVILQKNKIASAEAWLIFLDLVMPTETLYLVRNTEDKTYNSQVYTAFPFEIGVIQDSSKGNIPSLEIKVSNVTRAIQVYVEDLDGLTENCSVTIRIINTGDLDDVALEQSYDILGCVCDEQWVTFTLGAPNPLRRSFPPYRFIADFCQWIPGGAECTVAAATNTCDRTLSACRVFNNSSNFGGQIGLSNPSVRLV